MKKILTVICLLFLTTTAVNSYAQTTTASFTVYNTIHVESITLTPGNDTLSPVTLYPNSALWYETFTVEAGPYQIDIKMKEYSEWTLENGYLDCSVNSSYNWTEDIDVSTRTATTYGTIQTGWDYVYTVHL